MDENQAHLTVEQQILVSAAAEEILQTCSTHQQAMVRMLAVASEHKLNAANLILDLSREMKSATAATKVGRVAEHLDSGESVEDALNRVADAVPEPALMAFSAVRDHGLQQPLNKALLNAVDWNGQHPASADDFNLIDCMSGLEKKLFFVFSIITFVMLFIVPQFRDMYEEFGIELPDSMKSFVVFSNLITNFWFVFAFIFMGIVVYLILKRPRMITSYFTRWVPGRWQQPAFTAAAEKDLSLSWVAQASDDSSDVAMQYVSNSCKGAQESNRVAAAAKIKSGGEVWETLASEQLISGRASEVVSASSGGQSAAWLLRAMACEKSVNSDQRSYTRVRCLVWFGEFLLMFVGGWLAIAIFQCLITIIRGLTGYV
jgi:hypothetical protein